MSHRMRFLALAYAWILLLLLATDALGQTVTLGVAEVRHSEHGRQDAFGVEIAQDAGPVRLVAEIMSRHGDRDDANSGHPWVTVLAGRSLGPIGAYAGFQGTPNDNYSRPTFLAGPRLDLPLGSRAVLTLSHLWRARGLVQTRMTRWTPETLFRLSWRIQ